jgi:hypothetical protein
VEKNKINDYNKNLNNQFLVIFNFVGLDFDTSINEYDTSYFKNSIYDVSIYNWIYVSNNLTPNTMLSRQLMNVTRYVFKRYILYGVYSIYNANPLIISLNYASFTTNRNPFIFYIKKKENSFISYS